MSLGLEITQKQILSQRMIQSASILQMSSAELEEYLNREALENPVIDLVEKEPDEEIKKEIATYEWISSHDEQNRYLYQTAEADDNEFPEWNFDTHQGESLADYLWEQLIAKHIPEEYYDDLRAILESLDERGYFSEPTDEFLQRFPMDQRHFQLLLGLVQSLEPAGVGARSLGECLSLQLERKGLLSGNLSIILDCHLEQVARNQLPAIAKRLSVPVSEVKYLCSLIKSLDPKPGAHIGGIPVTQFVTPDIIVRKQKDGLKVTLNEALYPDISMNAGYLRLYRENQDKEVRDYLEKKIHQAKWIRQCVTQRNTTLMRTALEITSYQSGFFMEGSSLKPMRLLDISEALGVHESTVSRAIHGKYLQCSHGTFQLGYFFAKKAVRSASGPVFRDTGKSADTTSADIKKALRDIISNENKKKPYSDRVLSEKLGEKGYSISRRTVAKYRDEEHIPDASGRKEYT